jgi:GntR family transcriptional regulator/MocR family aminotransferase
MSLYRHIRGLIQDGFLQNEAKLPSIRSLQEQTKLSKTTIETAYHMLLEEGYVYSKPRAGLFVINPQALSAAVGNLKQKAAAQDRSHRHSTPLPLHSDQVLDFSLLAVDGESFPVRPWKSVLHDALSLHICSVHQYGDPQGEFGLRFQLAQYLKHSRGVNCLPEQIVIGSGISYSVQILSKLLEGITTIAVEEAGIAQVRAIFQQHRFDIVPISLNSHEHMIAELKDKGICALYLTPSHRPTGSPLSYSLRQQLLNWAAVSGAYLIEDDYDGEFRYSGKTIPSLQGLDQQGNVIYIGTFSKAFSPALRMNYMVLPMRLIDKLPSMEYALTSPSRIDQWAMQLFMERGHWYRHIRKIRNLYRKKHAKLKASVEANLSENVQINGDSAGLHLEITVKTTRSSDELIELAAAEDVLVYASQASTVKAGDYPKLYLGFGGLSERDIERGIRLLAKAWSEVISSPAQIRIE